MSKQSELSIMKKQENKKEIKRSGDRDSETLYPLPGKKIKTGTPV